MALFDKVKSQAQDVAKRAQEAGKIGQAKIDDFQAKRQLDALYRDLGEAVYKERTADGPQSAVDTAMDAVTAQIAKTAAESSTDSADQPMPKESSASADQPMPKESSAN